EAGKHRGALADLRKDPCLGVLADVMGDNELTEGTRALGMHAALRDHFAIEVRQLLQEPDVLQQHGTAGPCGHHILVICNGGTCYRGESWFVCHILSPEVVLPATRWRWGHDREPLSIEPMSLSNDSDRLFVCLNVRHKKPGQTPVLR